MEKTVLVTGATGYIAKHIVRDLLAQGWRVRATSRDPGRKNELLKAVMPTGGEGGTEGRLSVVGLDLTSDTGWAEAMAGVDALMHTASPFPLRQPKNPDDAIRPAVEGTRRALEAATAAGVPRAVVTSSVAAMWNVPAAGDRPLGPDDWSATEGGVSTAYGDSKTLAERTAWELADRDGAPALTTINPGFVAGPPLDRAFGTSVQLVQRILSGKDPMVPPLGFSTVDVRDVAQAHVRALERPETAGLRIPVAGRFVWMKEMAEALSAAFPDRKIATRQAPAWMIRLMAPFDLEIRSVVPMLNTRVTFTDAPARDALGLTFRDPVEAVVACARWLDREGLA